jgi:excisionase family DNA binding protein
VSERLLRAQDVADRLACSKRQAFKLMASGAFPVVRIGTMVRVRPDDLDVFIEQSRVAA